MEIQINIEKKHIAFFLVGIALVLLAGLVFAGFDPQIPNPGHAISELQKCQDIGNCRFVSICFLY
jgi:hypothetical protein